MQDGLIDSLRHNSENVLLLTQNLHNNFEEARENLKNKSAHARSLRKQYDEFKRELQAEEAPGSNQNFVKQLQRVYRKFPFRKGIEMRVGSALKERAEAKERLQQARSDSVLAYQRGFHTIEKGICKRV